MAEKFLTQEQLSVFCSSLAMLLRSGASLSEAVSYTHLTLPTKLEV